MRKTKPSKSQPARAVTPGFIASIPPKIKAVAAIVLGLAAIHFGPWLMYRAADEIVYRRYLATTHSQEALTQAYQGWFAHYGDLLFVCEFVLKILLTLAVMRLILPKPLKQTKAWLPFRRPGQFFMGLLLGAVAITLVFLALVLTGGAEVLPLAPSITINMITYLVVFILVSLSEELFFRGFLMTALSAFGNRWVSIIVSSLLFSFVHLSNGVLSVLGLVNIVLVGIVFAYAFERTNSLLWPVGYHITWNYFQGIVYGFIVSGIGMPGILTTQMQTATIFNGGAFGPEGGLLTTAVTLLMLVALHLSSKRQAKKRRATA